MKSATQKKITEKCSDLEQTLLSKNTRYGNSFGDKCPLCDNIERDVLLLARMGDKISRIKEMTTNGNHLSLESLDDAFKDLAGYCVLMLILRETLRDEKQSKAGF